MAEFDPILPYGLTIHRLIATVRNQSHDLVIGPELPMNHKTQKYTNTVVGRYANRIPVGKHRLERNGITSDFNATANENPRVSLHGGPVGFDALTWKEIKDDPTLFTRAEITALTSSVPESAWTLFRLVSQADDQGYPGTLIVETLVALVPPLKVVGPPEALETSFGSVVLVYRSKLAEDNGPIVTPINLTQHWGFNLDASLPSHDISIKGHILNLKTDRMVKRDADSLSLGFLSTVGLPDHTHVGKRIRDKYPDAGYDDYYLFENAAILDQPTRIPASSLTPDLNLLEELLRPSNVHNQDSESRTAAAELSSEISGFKLSFDTNQKGLMVYTNGLATPAKGARKKIHGGSGVSGYGDAYGPGTAVFLEFHNPLATFLDPENKNKEDTLLASEEIYHNSVRCDVSISGQA